MSTYQTPTRSSSAVAFALNHLPLSGLGIGTSFMQRRADRLNHLSICRFVDLLHVSFFVLGVPLKHYRLQSNGANPKSLGRRRQMQHCQVSSCAQNSFGSLAEVYCRARQPRRTVLLFDSKAAHSVWAGLKSGSDNESASWRRWIALSTVSATLLAS